MRRALMLLFAFANIFFAKAQTTTVALNQKVYELNDSVNIDLNGDLVYDIYFYRYTAVDHTQCQSYAMFSNVKLSEKRLISQAFTFFSSGCVIDQASIGCDWNTVWTPNTGLKYEGTYFVNNPGDTTFGYLTMEFVDPSPNSCYDTLFIYSFTFSNQPNVHLTAGQVLSGINETENNLLLAIFPNPATNELKIQSTEFKIESIDVYNVVGEKILHCKMHGENKVVLDLRSLPSGIYFIEVMDEKNNLVVRKIVKM